MMISFNVGDSMKFNYRSAGLLVLNNRILFQRFKNDDYWFLPGGRVEMMEDSHMAIDREILEEYGWKIKSRKLKLIVENFFKLDDKDFHEIGMYYMIQVEEKILLIDEEFMSLEDNLISRWIKIEELDKYHIVPPFLRDTNKLNNILTTDTINHMINRG